MKRKQFDLGFGCLGNGVTVYNRKEEVNRDYRTVAHIANDGTVKIYDEDLPEAERSRIQEQAVVWAYEHKDWR